MAGFLIGNGQHQWCHRCNNNLLMCSCANQMAIQEYYNQFRGITVGSTAQAITLSKEHVITNEPPAPNKKLLLLET